jgi:hypothetical protein
MSSQMPRYYFDVRDGENFSTDEEGIDLQTLENAWLEAALSAAEMAKDKLPERLIHGDQQMTVDIRDEYGPVLAISVTISVEPRR